MGNHHHWQLMACPRIRLWQDCKQGHLANERLRNSCIACAASCDHPCRSANLDGSGDHRQRPLLENNAIRTGG